LFDAILDWQPSLDRLDCVMAWGAIVKHNARSRKTHLMSDDETQAEPDVATLPAEDEVGEGEETPKRRLQIDVDIADVGPCKKHIKISIPRSEIDLQYKESLDSLLKEAQVPGFRPGKAPRQLVVKRFRKEVADQVKSTLLMSSLDQIDKDYQLEPITQPRLDLQAIEIPDSGPLDFEMDIEVRPQFEIPSLEGLTVERPVKTITEKEVDAGLSSFLERWGRIVPKLDGVAEIGDYLTADLTFYHPDGRVLSELKETKFRLQPELRLRNGSIADAGAKLAGSKPGDVVKLVCKLSAAVDDPALRHASIPVDIKVNDLKRMELPEVDQAFLDKIDYGNVTELREAVREALERRFEAAQRQAIRRQLLDKLLASTPFDLPPELVSREEASTIRRLVSELRQEGMTDADIRAREMEIRSNAHQMTLRSLKEFLLLARIADSVGIKVEEEDLSAEIEAMSDRTGESPRRIRAKLEKEGSVEQLTTQILERKAIDHILQSVELKDVSMGGSSSVDMVETLDEAAVSQTESTGHEPSAVDAAEGGAPVEASAVSDAS
jgi:trigger factor